MKITIEKITIDLSEDTPLLEAIAKSITTTGATVTQEETAAETQPTPRPPKRAKKVESESAPAPAVETKPVVVAPLDTDTGEITFEEFKNQLLTAAAKLGNRKTMDIVTETTGCKSIGKVPSDKYQLVLDTLNEATALIA